MFDFMRGEGGGEDAAVKRRPRLCVSEVEFNVAVWKILKGKGSQLRSLEVLTGLTPDALKARAKRVEHDYSPEDIEPSDGLSPDEVRYYTRRYRDSSEPDVREWLGSISAPTRSRPDWRRSTDRVGSHGKSKRVRIARGAG